MARDLALRVDRMEPDIDAAVGFVVHQPLIRAVLRQVDLEDLGRQSVRLKAIHVSEFKP